MMIKIIFFKGIFLTLSMSVTGTMMTANMAAVRLYHLINTSKTWTEAQNFCRVNYADLATIDSMVENMQLIEGIGDTDVSSIWIGLERSETEWWVWSDGIGEVDVFPWDVSKSYGDCVLMRPSIYWLAHQCSDPKAFLCSEYDSQGTEIYFLITTPLPWRDAQTYCRQNHTDLVSVKTKEQNSDIHVRAEGNSIWIGLIREDWMWSDRSTTSFRNWQKMSPDNDGGAENCVVMRRSLQYQWDDIACNVSYPFLCYGEQKLKRAVVTVRLSSEVNLNLPAQSDSLLEQFQARLEEEGVMEIKLRWHADENQQIFNQKPNNQVVG